MISHNRIKRYIILLMLSILLLQTPYFLGKADAAEEENIKLIQTKIVKVLDGDTVNAKIGTKTVTIRLIGVNCPEIEHKSLKIKEQPYGKKAMEYTKKVLYGKTVYIQKDVQEKDKYGRLLGYIWLSKPKNDSEEEIKSKMFNAQLLLNGYAQVMTVPPNVRYADYFVKYERIARENKRGLWSDENIEKPNSGYDKAKEEKTAETIKNINKNQYKYIGNSNTKKFHYPSCKWAKEIKPSNIVYFSTREQAIKAGYNPCKVCYP
ncbi:MAG: thermonuclease family protein [Thermovenabulum sp.]|uniref:thermonuclease family protein n=1 Tax=Thermovenabulum sp. TaxID=3100335 RepID=UPI003C7D3F22